MAYEILDRAAHAGLGVGGSEHDSSHLAKHNRPRAHRARLQRHVQDGVHQAVRIELGERLYGKRGARLVVDGGAGVVRLELEPFESVVLQIGRQDIIRHEAVQSAHVRPRNVDVWLPDGYGADDKSYRVIYFHDGQNLFNPEWSFFTKTDWGIDETLQRPHALRRSPDASNGYLDHPRQACAGSPLARSNVSTVPEGSLPTST